MNRLRYALKSFFRRSTLREAVFHHYFCRKKKPGPHFVFRITLMFFLKELAGCWLVSSAISVSLFLLKKIKLLIISSEKNAEIFLRSNDASRLLAY